MAAILAGMARERNPGFKALTSKPPCLDDGVAAGGAQRDAGDDAIAAMQKRCLCIGVRMSSDLGSIGSGRPCQIGPPAHIPTPNDTNPSPIKPPHDHTPPPP